jgi:hypothetical protein
MIDAPQIIRQPLRCAPSVSIKTLGFLDDLLKDLTRPARRLARVHKSRLRRR